MQPLLEQRRGTSAFFPRKTHRSPHLVFQKRAHYTTTLTESRVSGCSILINSGYFFVAPICAVFQKFVYRELMSTNLFLYA